MTLVRSKEFAVNQDKYFDLALDEQVFIQKDNNLFHLFYKNVDDMNTYHEASVYEEVLEPDDDFQNALSAEEFREKLIVVLDRVDKKYASKCK